MSKKLFYETNQTPKTLIIGVNAPYQKSSTLDNYLEEFRNLVKADNIVYEEMLVIKLRDISPVCFFTQGKLEEIKKKCEELKIQSIIISDSLTPQQERNIEDFLGTEVTDRTQLILEIFEKAARSVEGKTQVAIAMLQHRKTRLAGKGVYLEQQSGAVGVRGGFGEKLKERDRRYLDSQITKYKKQLIELQKVRNTQRKVRLDSQIPQICLVGYTNAGKSTILNSLTHSDTLAIDKLFATLDTTTRGLFIDNKQKGIISDTVGFIQQLPPNLIAAFKSTLSELQYADLLLHVVDLSDTNWQAHVQVVNQILADLKIDKEMLYVFNKKDKIDPILLREPSQLHAITSPTTQATSEQTTQTTAALQATQTPISEPTQTKELADTVPSAQITVSEDTTLQNAPTILKTAVPQTTIVQAIALQEALTKYQPQVFTNAQSREGLEPLIDYLRSWSPER